MVNRILSFGVCALLFGVLSFGSAAATELKIGLSSEPTSIDPNFHNIGTNNALAYHFFDRLVLQDNKQRLIPGLAVSWKALDDVTWEFKLREGVSFHDGTPFTAEDVKYSIERIPKIPNSPSSYAGFIKQIVSLKIVDSHTIQMKTAKAFPLMGTFMSTFSIVCKKTAETFLAANPGVSEDIFSIKSSYYNSGELANGTGPFKFVEWAHGDRIVMDANGSYWGGKPKWDKVILKPIANGSSRVAALLAGDVGMIERVPPTDIKKLKSDSKLALSIGTSNRVIYIHMDSDRDQSPFVTDLDGNAISKNPLKDVRVRKAISMAINRPAIIDRLMAGLGTEASQILPDGFYGVSPNMPLIKYDPEGAKKLLAEAGWGKGFGLTVHSTNDRDPNDSRNAQAVGQFLSKIGIKTKVETLTKSIYFPSASKLTYSFMMMGWGSSTGEPGSTLGKLLHTHDKERGWGASNRGRFSDPKFDEMLETAMGTVDSKKRDVLLQKATEYVIGEKVGIIPVFYLTNSWATRSGLVYDVRTDGYTLASGVK